MPENQLVNGGFDEPYAGNHDCLILPVGGDPYIKAKGEVQTPEGWMTWFCHDPGSWDEPEVTHMNGSHYPERVQVGGQSMRMFTFNRRHWGGFFQKVEVMPERFITIFLQSVQLWPFENSDSYWDSVSLVRDGSHFTLEAFVHGWSNHKVQGYQHYGNALCSVGVGCGPVYIPAGEAPPLNGDPLNDAIGNFTFSIGIDPYGGENPFAFWVAWSEGAHIYNGYHDAPLSVTVRVPGLVGAPREPYERTYVLLPPDADAGWAAAVAEMAYAEEGPRFTIGGSADDAGIGDLDARRVIAVNPGQWPGPQTLGEFFVEFYPGVEYVPVDADTPEGLIEKLSQLE